MLRKAAAILILVALSSAVFAAQKNAVLLYANNGEFTGSYIDSKGYSNITYPSRGSDYYERCEAWSQDSHKAWAFNYWSVTAMGSGSYIKGEFMLNIESSGGSYAPNDTLEFARLYNNSSQCGIRLLGTIQNDETHWFLKAAEVGGSNTLYGTSPSSFTMDTWYQIDYEFYLSTTQGYAKVWVGGTSVIGASGVDTLPNGSIDTCYYGGSITAGEHTWCDLYGIILDDGPIITTTSLPNGQVNVWYNQTIAETGGHSTLTWSVASGSLPTGLSLGSSTGSITGYPSASGTSNFTVQVSDTWGITGTKALSIAIAP